MLCVRFRPLRQMYVGQSERNQERAFAAIRALAPVVVLVDESDQAGTTRDRHFGTADWGGRRFWLVDTGGLVPDSRDSMDRAIRRQVDLAVEQSDLVVMLVDGKEGLTPVDAEIAAHLRRAQRRAQAREREPQLGQRAISELRARGLDFDALFAHPHTRAELPQRLFTG